MGDFSIRPLCGPEGMFADQPEYMGKLLRAPVVANLLQWIEHLHQGVNGLCRPELPQGPPCMHRRPSSQILFIIGPALVI